MEVYIGPTGERDVDRAKPEPVPMIGHEHVQPSVHDESLARPRHGKYVVRHVPRLSDDSRWGGKHEKAQSSSDG